MPVPRGLTVTSWPSAASSASVGVVEGGPLVGVDRRFPRPSFWLAGQPNPVLGLADRPPPCLRVAGEAAPDVVARGAEDGAAVALAEVALLQHLERLVGQLEQADQVGDRRIDCGRPGGRAPLWSGRGPRPGRRRLSPPRPGSGPRAPCSRSAPPAGAPARPGRGRPPGPSPGPPAGRRASGARRRPVRSCRRGVGGPAAAGRPRWPRSRRRGRARASGSKWVRGWFGFGLIRSTGSSSSSPAAASAGVSGRIAASPRPSPGAPFGPASHGRRAPWRGRGRRRRRAMRGRARSRADHS